jgi:DNA-binding NtrC family response regulator
MNDARNEVARVTTGIIFGVDDEDGPRKVVERALTRAGFDVRTFENGRIALKALVDAKGRVDVVVTDLYMPELGGLELLAEVRQRWPDVGVVLMTGEADVATAVEAMRLGAYDYLVKPVDPVETLLPTVMRAVEHTHLIRRNEYLERRLNVAERFEGMVGDSEPMRYVYQLVDSVARTDATVLILGESGTGKELVARSIHHRSARTTKPFIGINCGALAENVLESELFGHVRGAFTGAMTARRGLFEEASGGTLFLDEVGELSPATQVRLLRVLQEGEVRPVGSNETRKVDVRIVAATNRALSDEVKAGRFREDLFYRLNVVTIRLPPLRDRRDDIPVLAMCLLAKRAERREKRVDNIAPQAMERLCAYSWPGNVRELENVIERAVVLTRSDAITVDVLPSELLEPIGTSAPVGDETTMPFTEARSIFELRYLRRALERASGNIAEAARLAGLDRSNFRRMLKRHRLDSRKG